ncbi:hypothetical protein [Flavobacterium urumqiense]|uniref:Uncharacterized protein n=1 Tax=Flavobacterium urumqiense TaxID=935224 RepID=A0A1H5SMF8_9FLAO|nr:hypothetical protein [Flavobacterium urumqiense]MBC7747779.1 hypothetical protein [Flavobacterium sp.]SEF51802.1 hypothetical protein SAMN04488130_101362 [Flavobacterium urumqiense]
MNLKNYKPLINLALLVAVAYILHKIIFYSFNIDDTAFHYSIEVLYLLFSVLSVIVLAVLLKVKEQSFDNIGMSFLLSTSIKMVVCYLILRPVLQASGQNSSIEKRNFFAMFILFLAMETILTIRILNKNQ